MDNDEVFLWYLFLSPTVRFYRRMLCCCCFLSSPAIVSQKRLCDTEGEVETPPRRITTMSFFDIFPLAHSLVLPKNALLLLLVVLFCLWSPRIASQERECHTEGEVEHFSSTRGNAFLPENTVKTDNDDVLLWYFSSLSQSGFTDDFVVVGQVPELLDPNTKRFKRTLIYFNTDTQYAHFRGNVCVWILF